jgi:diphthine-ammonia ligase
MTVKPRAMVSWSGGKDCFLAWHRVKEQFDMVGLLTIMTEDGARSRSHGLRPELLRRQASLLDLPHLTENASWVDYESAFARLLSRARALGVSHVIFGDIYPEENRAWAESICSQQSMAAVEPLFGEPTQLLVDEFISTGALAMITTTRDAFLDPSVLGQMLTSELVTALIGKGADPCGERGEFHTFVTRFSHTGVSIPTKIGVIHSESGCTAIDLTLSE